MLPLQRVAPYDRQTRPACFKNYRSQQMDSRSWECDARPRRRAALNYYTLVLAFAQGLPSLPWFRAVACICKQACGLRAAGAAPWVQCYLLSQPKRGSPQAGTGGSWAHAWLLTLTCLLMATRRHTQHREVAVFSGVATCSAAGPSIFTAWSPAA